MVIFSRVLLSFLLFFVAIPIFAESDSSPFCSPDLLSAIEPLDLNYHNRLTGGEAQKALDGYISLINENASCVDPYWKAARVAWWIGEVEPDKEKKREIFQRGIDFAQQAVQVDPSSLDAHFWLAVNNGSFGNVKGILKSLFLVKPIRADLEYILEKDPSYDEGAAYRVLGIVDYEVPGFAGGSKKRAEERLKKALELGPQNPFNLYYLAEYYERIKKDDLAKKYLDDLDALVPNLETAANISLLQDKGKVLRAKLKP